MIQISMGPQLSPVCLLQRFCRRNPIHPFWAFLHLVFGAFTTTGDTVSVGVALGVRVEVGVFEGVAVAESVGLQVAVGVSVLVAVAVGARVLVGVFVAMGTSAVRVAAAAFCTATSVATRSGAGMGSWAQAANTTSKTANHCSCLRGTFISKTPYSSSYNLRKGSHMMCL
jgi:hypothetical protein